MMKFFLIFVALTVCTINLALSQIMYNKVKPYSYQSTELLTVNQLPTLEYNVSSDGNLSIDNLNVNVKEKALLEKKGDKFVSRLKFKVNARKLGEISLFFKDVKLANGTTCYVYSTDYQIVAGPITQQSINANFLTIMKLPADELILETVFNSESDYDFTLSGVNYFSAFEKKEYDTPELQSDPLRDYECTYGEVKHFENTQLLIDYRCGDFGWPTYFNSEFIRSINDFQFSASRASCIILRPLSINHPEYDKRNYIGENGTLINFPYSSCGGEDDCGVGIVVGIYHNGGAELIVDATTSIPPNQEYLDKILFRFNAHHKYGTPWHLEGKDCKASTENFDKWRETIDWDEVIDYCGASLFLYDDNVYGADIYMLKMKQKPFYKEHHIGWSSQIPPDPDDKKYFAIGRKGSLPTNILYGSNKGRIITIKNFSRDDSYGFSGSILTTKDYTNNDELMSFGLLTWATVGNSSYVTLASNYFSSTFNNFNSINFFLHPNCTTTFTKIDTYLSQTRFSNIVHDEGSYKWMSSAENKTKCPSTQGINTSTNLCDFDINNYLSYIYDLENNCLQVNINPISNEKFPGEILPKGYRVYHKFGDQKTILFDSFNDNTDDISFPIDFCLTKCEILYLMTIGRTNINLAIDFYDSEGRILNNPGCENVEINLDFPFQLCDLFDISNVSVERVEYAEGPTPYKPCCKYKITFDLFGCDEYNPAFRTILNGLTYEYEGKSTKIKDISNVEIDYLNGTISFEQIYCKSTKRGFKFVFNSNYNVCISSAIIDFPHCACFCEMEKLELTLTSGGQGTGCDEDNCVISGHLNISDFNNCSENPYTHYSIEPNSLKFPIPENGDITNHLLNLFGCLEKGDFKEITIKIYKGSGDINPCIETKSVFCPLADIIPPCNPDCAEVEWEAEPFSSQFSLPGCPDCVVSAKVVFRRNTCNEEPTQEIQVLSFSTHVLNKNLTACSNCNYTPEEIYKIIIKRAIFQNKIGFQPILVNEETQKCYNTWRVVNYSCWAEYDLPQHIAFSPDGDVTPIKEFSPCEGSECCTIGLEVCRFRIPIDENNPDLGYIEKISVETIGYGTGGETCTGFTKEVINPIGFGVPRLGDQGQISYYEMMDVPCADKCTWLNINDEEFNLGDDFGKISLPEKQNELWNDKRDFTIRTSINDDLLNLHISSKIKSNQCSVTIYNIYGQEVLEQKFDISIGSSYQSFNISYLNSGLYIYRLTINGSIQYSNKFIIVK